MNLACRIVSPIAFLAGFIVLRVTGIHYPFAVVSWLEALGFIALLGMYVSGRKTPHDPPLDPNAGNSTTET
jgi:hypothetical protein